MWPSLPLPPAPALVNPSNPVMLTAQALPPTFCSLVSFQTQAVHTHTSCKQDGSHSAES